MDYPRIKIMMEEAEAAGFSVKFFRHGYYAVRDTGWWRRGPYPTKALAWRRGVWPEYLKLRDAAEQDPEITEPELPAVEPPYINPPVPELEYEPLPPLLLDIEPPLVSPPLKGNWTPDD